MKKILLAAVFLGILSADPTLAHPMPYSNNKISYGSCDNYSQISVICMPYYAQGSNPSSASGSGSTISYSAPNFEKNHREQANSINIWLSLFIGILPFCLKLLWDYFRQKKMFYQLHTALVAEMESNWRLVRDKSLEDLRESIDALSFEVFKAVNNNTLYLEHLNEKLGYDWVNRMWDYYSLMRGVKETNKEIRSLLIKFPGYAHFRRGSIEAVSSTMKLYFSTEENKPFQKHVTELIDVFKGIVPKRLQKK